MVVHYGNHREAAENVVREITDSGGLAMARLTDVTDEDAIGQLFESVFSESGGLDVVVANAGIAGGGPIEQVELADFKRLVIPMTSPEPLLIDLCQSSGVSTAFKVGGQPDFDNSSGGFRTHHPLADGDHVGVVMLAGQGG